MIRCAIVGVSGYTGVELAEILTRHPDASITACFGSSDALTQRRVEDLHPRLRAVVEGPVLPARADAILAHAPHAVFLCTPHEVSARLAPALLDHPAPPVVLDLSGAFRLTDPALYPRFYAFEHPRPDLLASSVYGLAELGRDRLRVASLIAVPGCYPTSVILPLSPLVRAGALRTGPRPVIDSTSGVSGAGRTPSDRNLFCEVSQQPYGVFSHRHGPEIELHVGARVVFTPHLGPYDRGIVSTIHAELAESWTDARVRELLARAYVDAPFVRLLPPGVWPSAGGVRTTNFCDIALAVDQGHLILVSAIDNLVKGAAGQAVQCMNIRFNLPEAAGLLPSPKGPAR